LVRRPLAWHTTSATGFSLGLAAFFVATLGGGDFLLHDNFYPSLYLDY
jgi:hypothetical protein